MRMQIGKWGNSLAVRLPREIVEQFGLVEGDMIDSSALEAALAAMQRTTMAERRAAALKAIHQRRFALPQGYKFDRDEANAR